MPRFNLQDKSRGWQLYHKTVIGVTALILLLPIAATVIYAFSSSWGATILPEIDIRIGDGLSNCCLTLALWRPWAEASSFVWQRLLFRRSLCCLPYLPSSITSPSSRT